MGAVIAAFSGPTRGEIGITACDSRCLPDFGTDIEPPPIMAEDIAKQTRESLVQLAPWAQPFHEPIPGERDPSTLTHREAGAVSGQFAGADIPPQPPDWLDRRTAFEHALEGGGDAVKGDRPQKDQAR
jgi:hypothetical protein